MWRFFVLALIQLTGPRLQIVPVSSNEFNHPSHKLPQFDPRLIPVEGVDAHLPAVAPAALQPDALRQRFTAPPVWSPELLAEVKFTEREPLHASVLVPIVMRAQPTVLLTQRTAHLSTHSGQIAFPGGKADEGDADACATALREAQEEIGLDHAGHRLGANWFYADAQCA